MDDPSSPAADRNGMLPTQTPNVLARKSKGFLSVEGAMWFDCSKGQVREPVVHETETSREQRCCEEVCLPMLKDPWLRAVARGSSLLGPQAEDTELLNADGEVRLLRNRHAAFLVGSLQHPLPSGFVSLDASRPWMCYWIIHALSLLDREPHHLYGRVVATLDSMQNKETGGYGGGVGQMSHCAPTYAAVLCLCSIGTREALSSINRVSLYSFLKSMKDPVSCGFRMHHDGEVDSRSTFTALCVARLVNILTDELVEGTAEYLLACQTYEGGFGGEPGNEAHGGYNFCALASLLILQQTHRIDLEALEHWLLFRQMKVEGGFQGRTNKLVDSCYSFWQGSAQAIVNIIRCGGDDVSDVTKWTAMNSTDDENEAEVERIDEDGVIDVSIDDLCRILPSDDLNGELACNQRALQMYILHCSQNESGGLRDKPGKSRDFYHSCYALSGLSIAQSSQIRFLESESSLLPLPVVHGDADNLVRPTSAVFNIRIDKVGAALDFFGGAWQGGGLRTESGLLLEFEESQ